MNKYSKSEIEKAITAFPHWYHRINLGHGIYTHNRKTIHEELWSILKNTFPENIENSTVLDIGCNAGFFSIEAKKKGAKYVLGIETSENYIQRAPEKNEPQDQILKQNYYLEQAELCKNILNLDIEYKKLNANNLHELEYKFDIVFFMGVLYHLKNPFATIEAIGNICNDTVVIETEIISENGQNRVYYHKGKTGNISEIEGKKGMMKFIETNELNCDNTNWWIPDTECVKGMFRIAGFKYFSEPCYYKRRRLLILASKNENPTLNFKALS